MFKSLASCKPCGPVVCVLLHCHHSIGAQNLCPKVCMGRQVSSDVKTPCVAFCLTEALGPDSAKHWTTSGRTTPYAGERDNRSGASRWHPRMWAALLSSDELQCPWLCEALPSTCLQALHTQYVPRLNSSRVTNSTFTVSHLQSGL